MTTLFEAECLPWGLSCLESQTGCALPALLLDAARPSDPRLLWPVQQIHSVQGGHGQEDGDDPRHRHQLLVPLHCPCGRCVQFEGLLQQTGSFPWFSDVWCDQYWYWGQCCHRFMQILQFFQKPNIFDILNYKRLCPCVCPSIRPVTSQCSDSELDI